MIWPALGMCVKANRINVDDLFFFTLSKTILTFQLLLAIRYNLFSLYN